MPAISFSTAELTRLVDVVEAGIAAALPDAR